MNPNGPRRLSRIGEIDPNLNQTPRKQEQNSWPDDFDEFSRISRKAKVVTKRIIEGIYTPEQIKQFDREEFSDIHFQLSNVLRAQPNDAKALIGLGVCSMAVYEPDKATQYFGKVLDIEATFQPGKFITEVDANNPEHWLKLAEGIGHLGFVEAAQDICDRVAKSGKFPPKIRTGANQLKKQIEQDFFAARERIITGNSPKQKEATFDSARVLSVFAFVVGPIIVSLLLGSWLYSSYQLSSGKTLVGACIYRYERLKAGDSTTERNASIISLLDRAQAHFKNSEKYNPLSIEATYMKVKTGELILKLGREKEKSLDDKWSPGEIKQYKDDLVEAKAMLKAREPSKETMEKEDKLWENFYKVSKNKPDNVLY